MEESVTGLGLCLLLQEMAVPKVRSGQPRTLAHFDWYDTATTHAPREQFSSLQLQLCAFSRVESSPVPLSRTL